jgi:crotonobetainyl-CoA:carnitine CoA-transferase CaiB-like acyl-CoA transferase
MRSSDDRGVQTAPSLLEGVKVLTLGAFVAGNVCPLVLAELGADVVKVETQRRPEALRQYYSPDHGPVFEPSGHQTTALYACLSRSVSSVCVELETPQGPAMLQSLAGEADILIENLGPGVMEKWGCTYEALAERNPHLVVVSISGYGRTGPRGEYRAYASSIANFLGLTSVYVHEGTHFDFVAAYHGAFAGLGAWLRASKTGDGAYLDVSQMETGAAVMAPLYLDALVNGVPWTQEPNEVPGSLLSAVVRCSGADAWAAVELEDLDDWWALCLVLERPELTAATENEARGSVAELTEALAAWANSLSSYQVSLKLQAAGLAVAPVQNGEDLWRDPQLRARAAFVEVVHPDLGTIEHPQSPDYMSVTPGRVTGRSRRLGEDTVDVLARWLRLEGDDIATLQSAGVVWQAPDHVPQSEPAIITPVV